MDTTSPALRRYLTPPQVAEMLGIASEKVHAWIHAGELRASNIAIRAGGRARWTISAEALEAFLAARQPQPPAPRQKRRRKPAGEVDYLSDIS